MYKAILASVAVIAALLFIGPRPISTADEATGDQQLAHKLADAALGTHHNLSAFTIKDGETTYAGLGADEHTEFEIGSITKMFTIELLRQQIADGKISADTSVGEVVDIEGEVQDVTVEELANHTSGLPRLANTNLLQSLWSNFSGGNPYKGESIENIVDAAQNASLEGRGEREYSNLGYALLGHVLAINADTPYPALLKENILAPLEMNETYLMSPGSVSEDAPRGHRGNGKTAEPWEMDGSAPAGAIRSTATDMAKFAENILDNYTEDDFTLGWVKQEDHGYYWHNGGTYGYSSMLIIDPGSETAAYTVTDTETETEETAAALINKEF